MASDDRSPRSAGVRQHGIPAGVLEETDDGWRFSYDPGYEGPPVSLTMPLRREPYAYDDFPPFFEGLLPEGLQLEALLRRYKIDRGDVFTQLVTVGSDLVGSVTVSDGNRH